MIEAQNYFCLGDDFFESRAIRKIRKFAGGDTYTIIYLKMLVLASRNNGRIFSEGIGSPMSEEIALALNETKENVSTALHILEDCGLIENVSDTEIRLKYQELPDVYKRQFEPITWDEAYRICGEKLNGCLLYTSRCV